MNRHRRTAISKNVANEFSDSELPTWGTRDGEFNISCFVDEPGVIEVVLVAASLWFTKILNEKLCCVPTNVYIYIY